MKFKPFGIYSEDATIHGLINADDLSDKNYEGVETGSTAKEFPVVILHSKESKPLPWKVVYGFSQVYFRSFAEAMDFCNSRGMEIVKKQIGK